MRSSCHHYVVHCASLHETASRGHSERTAMSQSCGAVHDPHWFITSKHSGARANGGHGDAAYDEAYWVSAGGCLL
jgi:hypothetical protein